MTAAVKPEDITEALADFTQAESQRLRRREAEDIEMDAVLNRILTARRRVVIEGKAITSTDADAVSLVRAWAKKVGAQ